MNELVESLGWSKTTTSRIAFFGLLGLGTVGYLRARQLFEALVAPEPWVLQISLWACWLVWQGYFFQKHRVDYLARHTPSAAYRTAFLRDILPDATCAFALMAWPLFTVMLKWSAARQFSTTATWVDLAWAGPILILGVSLLAAAVRTIGVSGALFLREYVTTDHTLTNARIYSYIRHPLFLGAVAVSLGTAGLTGDNSAVALGLINLAIMPVYRMLEDRRQEQVYGDAYRRYRASVNAFLPSAAMPRLWLRRLQSSHFFIR